MSIRGLPLSLFVCIWVYELLIKVFFYLNLFNVLILLIWSMIEPKSISVLVSLFFEFWLAGEYIALTSAKLENEPIWITIGLYGISLSCSCSLTFRFRWTPEFVQAFCGQLYSLYYSLWILCAAEYFYAKLVIQPKWIAIRLYGISLLVVVL